jgi:hypothetical protein
MGHSIYVSLFAVGLFLGMVILLEVGRRIGVRRLVQDPEGAEAGVGTVEGLCLPCSVCLLRLRYSRYRISAFGVYPSRRFRPRAGGAQGEHEVRQGLY